ncbi:wall-associated receptor kinase-like 1 [Olea europaea var. sylvestris]|uniref:wall-associated receptor kinase-like 1 n=1 Tax=Olea europaea var. sylvestris TaxID=158386 RepID=UPI000C1D5AF8|nr:wall-associated receptor kinase-like 1 [Olea europaea var. sylvestris]
MFLHIVCLLSLAVALPSNVATSPKPGCESTCGNLQVPYPFGIGIGSNCSMSSDFDIYCNTTDNPPRAYLTRAASPFEVVKISETNIYVKNWRQQQIVACYASREYFSLEIDYFANSPYTLSDANQLTVFGCDDLAIGQHLSSDSNYSAYGAGTSCAPYCESREVSGGTGSCPGNGCCQTSISKGKKFMMTRLINMERNWQRRKLFSCSFLSLGMMNITGFTFRLSDLNDSTFLNKYPAFTDIPLVLDWRIGSQNCSEMLSSSSYACKENSYCDDSLAGVRGYNCRCMKGYEGTPYLSPGCHDINECKNSPCHSNGICINTPGSFHCYCPNGYYGDGSKNGAGCIRMPGSNSKVAIGASLGAGMGFLLQLLTCFWLLKFLKKRKNKKQKEEFFKRNGGLLLQQQISKHEDILEKTRLFTAKDLDMATDHFNESRILGQGGQGTVYKGMLSDGKLVAVKKSKLVDENQVEQFINEVVILSEINQRNVVKLLGCCLETEVPLLVYEFISNGTLFDLIHDDSAEFPFLWNMRLKIAVEVAGALAYLHYATSVPIYHRDIKSSNILLDEKYVSKVSDFGTSRSIEVDKTHLTTLVKGTFGYLDPEYFQSSQFTEKSDVYSFGVVLVELLTGKRPISSDRTEEERSLATRFLLCMERNNLETILNSQVLEQGKREELTAVAKVAQRCLNLNGKNRPTMKEVAMELESIKMSQTLSTSVETTFEGVRLLNGELAMLPDADYTWTSISESTFTSSDVTPFMTKTF